MTRIVPTRLRRSAQLLLVSSAVCASLGGCKSKPAGDQALLSAVQAQIAGDTALNGQPIQATVQNGVVTLSGSTSDATQRTVAARDVASVPGVREVVNNLSVAAATATAPAPMPVPAPAPAPVPSRVAALPTTTTRATHQAAPIERHSPSSGAAQQPSYSQSPAQSTYVPPPPVQQAPPPPPQPVFRTVTVPAGNGFPVRVTQTLDSASSQRGDSFSGVVASDIVVDGVVAIPAGSAVSGTVTDVRDAAHFKGSSMLSVSINSVSRRGERLPVSAEPYVIQGKGRGANTAEKTGGGAAVGAILGGIFGGGKGAAIGAGAGAGVGAGANAVTRGQQVSIPSESVVRFQLTSPLSVRVRTDSQPNRGDGGLLTH